MSVIAEPGVTKSRLELFENEIALKKFKKKPSKTRFSYRISSIDPNLRLKTFEPLIPFELKDSKRI